MGNKCPKCGAYLVDMPFGRGGMCPECEYFIFYDILFVEPIVQKEENPNVSQSTPSQ